MTSPYAVPLSELVDSARVAQAQQVTEQSEPRLQHLPGDPVTWTAGGLAGGGQGGADCADGDC